ncbi:transcriptional regulator [Paracandidimonas lactea]|uniref:transcriptional regulator n=1 Tax=Paracandidimonas lactea TaxID=2895524 RepID=UPI00272E1A80|nr:helix-turn-helix domain-containing protein [Paracandidimonas lactea]
MNLLDFVNQERGKRMQLAIAIGVPPILISQWANRKRQVPAERCPDIERATAGAVRCEDLRPDIDWSVLRTAPPITRAELQEGEHA